MVWKMAFRFLEEAETFIFSNTFTLTLGPTQLNIQCLPEDHIHLFPPHSSFAADSSVPCSSYFNPYVYWTVHHLDS
jgi:hypothetical protein